MSAVGLSKSRFVAGLQCHRALWWKVHDEDAPELATGREQQAIFDQGTRIGEFAREYVPGGALIDLPYSDFDARIEATRRAIDAGANVLYEASFRADDVFVSVDILHRSPNSRGWTVSEVKSTTSVKLAHIPDAAVQTHVLRRAGLPIHRTEVMHLNRACRHPDLTNLFTRSDVSAQIEELLPAVPSEVRAQLAMLQNPEPPHVEPGDHCTAPYECPFLERCCGASDAPSSAGEVVIEHELREVLAELRAPIAHLDFETINPAIPVWPGCRPYDQVPVQFSVHTEPTRWGAKPTHVEWLASGAEDPRRDLARALVDALCGARTIIVYHQPFEEARLRELQEAVPELAEELGDIIERLVDLLPIMRTYVAHPGFGGRFGLKRVAPIVVPGLRYEDLPIGNAGMASRTLQAMLLGPKADVVNDASMRASLLAYCGQDTLATMGVLAWLREVA